MISFFRKNRKGVFNTILLGVLVLLMLPFGVDLLGNSQMSSSVSSQTVANVGDHELSVQMYSNEINRIRKSLQAQFGENYEMIEKSINLKQQVLDSMIDRQVLSDFFHSSALGVGRSHIEAYVRGLPMFNGGVTKDSFNEFLRSQNLSEGEFRGEVSAQLLREQLSNTLGLAAVDSPENALRKFKVENEKFVFSFSKIPPMSMADLEVSPQEEEDYYGEHRGEFLSPKRISFSIIQAPLESFYGSVPFDDQDIADAYRARKQMFRIPDRAQILQAQFLTTDDLFAKTSDAKKGDDSSSLKFLAETFRNDIAGNPEEFAAIARERGAIILEDSELKEVSKLAGAIRSEIPSMSVGEVSSVIATDNGFIVFILLDAEIGKFQEAESLRPELEEMVKAEMAPQIAQVTMKRVRAELEGISLDSVTPMMKDKATQEDWQYRATDKPLSSSVEAKIPEELWAKLWAQSVGGFVLDEIEGTIYLGFVSELVEPAKLELTEVRPAIKAILRAQKQTASALENARQVIEMAKGLEVFSFEGFQTLVKKQGLAFTDVAEESLDRVVLPISADRDESRESLIDARIHGFSTKPLVGEDGEVYLVFRKSITSLDSSEVNLRFNSYLADDIKSSGEMMIGRLVDGLKKEMEIRINDEVISQF